MKVTETKVFGLKHELRYNSELDDLDWISCEHDCMHTSIPIEFSKQNGDVLVNWIIKLKEKGIFKTIMEIGVQRSGELSSTSRMMTEKPQETIYVGIDIKEKSISTVNKPYTNSYGLVSDSSNYDYVCYFLDKLNVKNIDLLIIDGFHSINQLYKDFKYAERLSVGGIVFLHDTNYHPGPKTLLNCIDERIFSQKRYFEEDNDWGCAVLERV